MQVTKNKEARAIYAAWLALAPAKEGAKDCLQRVRLPPCRKVLVGKAIRLRKLGGLECTGAPVGNESDTKMCIVVCRFVLNT
eukprot:2974464-Amphidinium_carterae.1